MNTAANPRKPGPPAERPAWVSEEMFPFQSRWFETQNRQTMHYIDEGQGEPIVFVHGNPTWSFEFRHLILGLHDSYRCIAMDHIGFGLSSCSGSDKDYHPRAHAENLHGLMDKLGLENITLFLTDWGGPIGLDFARRRPERIRRLIIANTWAWPVSGDPHFVRFSSIMSSRIGRFLIRRLNIFVNMVLPKAVGDRSIMTKAIMHHYRRAQATPFERSANAALPGYIIGASDWLGELWAENRQFIDKPALLLWGFKDIAFRRREYDTWREHLTRVEPHEFPHCGHLIAEEAPEETIELTRAFIEKH